MQAGDEPTPPFKQGNNDRSDSNIHTDSRNRQRIGYRHRANVGGDSKTETKNKGKMEQGETLVLKPYTIKPRKTQGTTRWEDYEAFVGKFETARTTDDCQTPAEVYGVVAEYAKAECPRIGAAKRILRPFWPGADYTSLIYEEGDAVVDNPPFSILTQIVRFYSGRDIPFFLFAQGLTLFSVAAGEAQYVCTNASITYENGAKVLTSFVTNALPGGVKIRTAPGLKRRIEAAHRVKAKFQAPKYIYPAGTFTLQDIRRMEAADAVVDITRAEFVRGLDSQKKVGKAIYGGGFLIAESEVRKMAEAERRAKGARAAAPDYEPEPPPIEWELSERERAIINRLGE